MRIVVTAKEQSVDSPVDQRFGRARYLVLIDTESGHEEIHNNEVNLNAVQGAGIQTAQNVAQLGVEAVLTGHLGPNSYRTLSAAGIKAYTGFQGTVRQAVEALKAGGLKPLESADVEGHWV